MSKSKIGILNCPKCNNELKFTEWESINADLNPEEKEKILSGDFGEIICSSCKAVLHIQYPFLYHDMKHAYMIGVFNSYADVSREAGIPYGYKTRTVSSYEHLLEKIRIFDDEIDDVVLEFVKEIVRPRMKLNDGEEIFYMKIDQEYLYFENHHNDTMVEVQRKIYDKALSENADLEDVEDDYFCKVDRDLILNAIKNM